MAAGELGRQIDERTVQARTVLVQANLPEANLVLYRLGAAVEGVFVSQDGQALDTCRKNRRGS
jgi:hypothetical protein